VLCGIRLTFLHFATRLVMVCGELVLCKKVLAFRFCVFPKEVSVFMDGMRQFYFTPSYQCDNDCAMCGVRKKKRLAAAHFSLDECKSLIDKMNLTTNDILELSGGEPIIYKNFIEVIKYAKEQYNPTIIVLSNGKRLSDQSFFDSIRNIGIDRFIIPLFSTTTHVHDTITQAAGSFSQTCQGLGKLEQAKIPYSIKFIAMKPNYQDISSVYRMKLERYPSADYIIKWVSTYGRSHYK
jgi:MoaA/NifB/PqqE/SkfB family radical SAM enzyme